MQKSSKYFQLTMSGIFLALYLVVMLCTQGFAFGQYQIRIATALYGLSAIFPFLVIPSCLANFLSNMLLGGLGPLDMLGGALVGLLTSSLIVWGKRRGWGNWIILVAVTMVPGLGVPLWLAVLLDIPYLVLASSLLVGQLICGISSLLLVGALEKVTLGKHIAMKNF